MSAEMWIHTIFEPFLWFSSFWTKLAILTQCAARHVEESAHLNLKSATIFGTLNKTWTWREKWFLTLFSDFLVFEQSFQFRNVCNKALWIRKSFFGHFLRFSSFWTKLVISAQRAARHVEESAHLNLKSATIFGPFQCANHCLQELCLLLGQKFVLFFSSHSSNFYPLSM